MNNTQIINKVIELNTMKSSNRNESERLHVVLSVICKSFGIVKDEINDNDILDYERQTMLTDKDIKEMFNVYVEYLELVTIKNRSDLIYQAKNRIDYFIEGVEFFNKELAKELKIGL